jgi:hypothetical protein
VARLVSAAVVIDLAPFLGKPAGGHESVPFEPDCLEGFTYRAKRHDLDGLGDVFSIPNAGAPFFFDRCHRHRRAPLKLQLSNFIQQTMEKS